MEPKLTLLDSLIGNLSGTINYSPNIQNSPGAKSKLKNSMQININMNIAGDVIQQKVNTTVSNTELAQIFKAGYQAVFLDNGQVYFGRLEKINKQRFVELRNVFYLKEDSSSTDYTLVKLGQEIHAPSDVMHIQVSKVLFWENLKDEGDVVSAILKYKSPKRV